MTWLVLFRSSRPDYIETKSRVNLYNRLTTLFRSSRPDYIETDKNWLAKLRDQSLFRSSRPDYIETRILKDDFAAIR